jgi:2-amino-4-hydroxy-6-hydroxymethyldihydropteridine diphosphokinase
VLLALGSNLEVPERQLAVAVEQLGQIMEIEAVSDVYLTEPVGNLDQPDFLNLVVRGRTHIPVYELLRVAGRIEDRQGRRRGERNGPRVIDVDVLAFGELVLRSAELEVPHPRMMDRAFVLVPLAQVAPEWRNPVSSRSAEARLAELDARQRISCLGPLRPLNPPIQAIIPQKGHFEA